MVAASSAGHSGAASATWEHVHRHFAVAALLSPETPLRTFFGQTIELHVDFRLDGGMEASRLHAAVKSQPVCGDHSAQSAKSHTGGFWYAPHPLPKHCHVRDLFLFSIYPLRTGLRPAYPICSCRGQRVSARVGRPRRRRLGGSRSRSVARWSRRSWRHSTSPTAGRPPSPGRCASHWPSRSRPTRRMER